MDHEDTKNLSLRKVTPKGMKGNQILRIKQGQSHALPMSGESLKSRILAQTRQASSQHRPTYQALINMEVARPIFPSIWLQYLLPTYWEINSLQQSYSMCRTSWRQISLREVHGKCSLLSSSGILMRYHYANVG